MSGSIKSRETFIRQLAGSCGLRFEKPRNPSQYGGWTYILWDATGKGTGANDVNDIETHLRQQYPDQMPRKNMDRSTNLAEALPRHTCRSVHSAG